MANAETRFESLMKALHPPHSMGTFRELMMKAYDLEPKELSDSSKTTKLEKEFAEKCLNGKGPTTQELTARNDLRAVLLKEIGLIPEEDKEDEMGNPVPIIATPWLMGDWVQMAKMIIHYADVDMKGSHDGAHWKPADMVRLWPIASDSGVRGWRKETFAVEEEGTHRLECFVKTYDRNKDTGEMQLRIMNIGLQGIGTKHMSYTWLILPEGPRKITTSLDKGIPRKLWSGLRHPPGTSQVSDPNE